MSKFKRITCLIAAVSLAGSSTAAVAITNAPVAPPASPWIALAALNGGAATAAVCGAAVVQPGNGCVLPVIDAAPAPAPPAINQPIPVPPADASVGGLFANPLLLALGAAALAGIIYAIASSGGGGSSNSPN